MYDTIFHSIFCFGLCLDIAAGACGLIHLARNSDTPLKWARRYAAVGLCASIVAIFRRGFQYGQLPFSTPGDTMLLFIVLSVAIALFVQREERARTLLALYLPAIAIIAAILLVLGQGFLKTPPRELSAIIMLTHVLPAFVAYALIFIASVTAIGYVIQSHRLKQHTNSRLAKRLPPLNLMDQMLFKFIKVGYPLFAFTMVFGVVLAWVKRADLADQWYLSVKIFLSVAMAAVYFTSFHARRLGLLRGPKLAYFISIGFTIVMTLYIASWLTNTRTAGFWGPS